jgi:ubiquinone/menaquinone biosynthesis C-methylase UbiE
LAALREDPGRNALEVAVGAGTELAEVAKDPGFECLAGIDVSFGMLQRARLRLNASRGGRAWLCQADARALPFPGDIFDSLLNCYMLDLLAKDDIPVALSEFQRVLRPQGRLIVVTMARQGPLLQKIWLAAYHHAPLLGGGCRPVDTVGWLKQTGWRVQRHEQIRPFGFRSEGVVARPLDRPQRY